MEKEQKKNKSAAENVMRKIKIEKIVFNIGAVGDNLEKGVRLLKILTNRTPVKTKSSKRIPSLGVRPGLEIGTMVTIRKNSKEILKKMLMAVDNRIRKKQVAQNHLSFGIKEYLEIPGIEYQRDVGIMGLDITIVFKRTGRRVKLRKIKRGRFPQRQMIQKEEIIKFMEDNFQTKFVGK